MRKHLLSMLSCFIVGISITMAAESEPNNTWNTADKLTAGVAETGTITTSSDIDWFKLRINQEGQINFSGGVTNTGCLTFQLFDTLGIIALNSGVFNCGGISNQSTNGLAVGTYYVKVISSDNNVNYSVTLTLTTATPTNDVEANNTFSTAITQALNGSNTGHLGYYFNNKRDSTDWYKIVTTANGALQLSYTGNSGNCVYFQLFDGNGTTALNVEVFNCGGTSNQTTDGLAAGTYYVRIRQGSGNDFVTYTLSNTFIAPSVNVDSEPNNTFTTAITQALNGSNTGHLGYYFNNKRDSTDWYKIVTTANGALQLSYTGNSGNCVYFQLFDGNGTTALNAEVYNCGSTSTQTTDGLATGTYYVKIRQGSGNEFVTYTLSNTFIAPSVNTDPEPNNTRGTAKVIALNGTINGHIGYRFNGGLRDTLDWFKLTTTSAGTVQVFYTGLTGNCAYFQLYDNNATTAVSGEFFNCGGTNSLIVPGLNPGTYYIKIRPGNNTSQYATYTLSDTLILPLVAPDTEPNNQPSLAVAKLVNTAVTGLAGYYYNGVRDTADWYKINLPSSGGLQLQYTGNAGGCAYFQLFDTIVNGVLVPRNAEVFNCGSTSTQNTDGLGNGTYYVRIRPGTLGSDIPSYTLKDTLFTLPPDNDNKPNGVPFQGQTLPANETVTGNIGYSFNALRDSADWARINYTGTGNLSLQFSSLARAFAAPACLYLRIYSDTNAAPINTTFNCGSTSFINLTGLTQQYYYIKVETNNPSTDFGQYSVANFFAEANKASVALISSTQPTDCNPTGVLRVQCSGSKAPYTLRLFRFGVLDRVVRINNTLPTNITGLSNGIWTGRVFGDGASDTAFGVLASVSLLPVPTGLNTTNITNTQARLNFSNFTPCIDGYGIQYRKLGDIPWTLDTARQSPFTLRGLTPATTYQWRVASGDTANGLTAVSAFSSNAQFTTANTLMVANSRSEPENVQIATGRLEVYPNPATQFFTIHYGGGISGKINWTLIDINGRAVLSNTVDATQLNSTHIYINTLATGIYQLQLRGAEGMIIATEKVIVQR